MRGGYPSELYQSATYNSWFNRKRRCIQVSRPETRWHGQKGISYDSRWKHFRNFLEDILKSSKENVKGTIKQTGEKMRSHINTATFTKRIPTEQYAFEEYSLTAAIDASESGEDVLIEMRKQVSNAFAADLVQSTEQKEEKTKKADKKTAKQNEEKKNGKSKTRPSDDEDESGEDPADEDAGSDGEGAEDDEAADDDVQDDSDDSSDDAEDEGGEDDAGDDQGEESGEDDGEDGEEERKPAKGKGADKKGEGKKSFRKKPQTYNRGIDQHREIFSRVLRSVNPDWKNSDSLKARAKKISEALEGEDFLDENGEVLPEFKAEVKKRMTAKAK